MSEKDENDDYVILFQGAKLSKRQAKSVGLGIISGSLSALISASITILKGSLLAYITVAVITISGYLLEVINVLKIECT